MQREKVLVVDDETTVLSVIQAVLEEGSIEVIAETTAEAGLEHFKTGEIAIAMLDVRLPRMSGLQMLERIKSTSPDTEVLIMTSHASVETAVVSMRQGAYDFLQKPFEDVDEIWHAVQRALEKRRLILKNRALLAEREQDNRSLSAAVNRLSTLVEAGHAMSNLRTLPELLDHFIETVRRELDVTRASLMLLDESAGELKIAASFGLDEVENPERLRVPVGEGIAGVVAQTGKPILVRTEDDVPAPASKRKDLADSFISAPINLSLPIKFREHVLGVINITNPRTSDSLTEDDLDYLSGLAAQLAVAIEQARDFERLQVAYEKLKTTQDQLVASERLKAIGQMAAGVAHDFNNALGIILAKAQLADQKVQADPVDTVKVRRDLKVIQDVALQGAETIRRVQDYSRNRNDALEECLDLNELIQSAVQMTMPKWKGECEREGRHIEIALELGEIHAISGNRHQLTQLLSNLIFNAVEAMPEGGTLTFTTRTEGGQIVAEVCDTGEGMDEETRERLFEPFFTTKESGQGLGTSIIYAIVTRHRGEITVSSQKGKGTAFRLRFPRRQPPRPGESEQDESLSLDVSMHGVRILLVEDNDAARDVYSEALAVQGHLVTPAAGGAEALEQMKGGDSFDLVITDLSMPGLSGIDLAEAITHGPERTPVVLLSGWADQQDPARLRKAGIVAVLNKPCGVDDLLAVIQEALVSTA